MTTRWTAPLNIISFPISDHSANMKGKCVHKDWMECNEHEIWTGKHTYNLKNCIINVTSHLGLAMEELVKFIQLIIILTPIRTWFIVAKISKQFNIHDLSKEPCSWPIFYSSCVLDSLQFAWYFNPVCCWCSADSYHLWSVVCNYFVEIYSINPSKSFFMTTYAITLLQNI